MNALAYPVRLEGGPEPGEYMMTEDQFPWPPPMELPGDGGTYLRVGLGMSPADGADYEWKE